MIVYGVHIKTNVSDYQDALKDKGQIDSDCIAQNAISFIIYLQNNTPDTTPFPIKKQQNLESRF